MTAPTPAFGSINGIATFAASGLMPPEVAQPECFRLQNLQLKGRSQPLQSLACVDGVLFEQIRRKLQSNGIARLQLGFADPDGRALQYIVAALGTETCSHDQQGTTVWNVKYDSGLSPAKAARSQTMREFPMHTDGSFEDPPPEFVAMYVAKEDAYGAGRSLLIESRTLLNALSREAVETLMHTKYAVKVPDEFFKGESAVRVPLLDKLGNFRYRRELIIDEACSPEQVRAVDEMDALLYDSDLVQSMFLETGTILIFDNGKFLHGRTSVKDPDRHLLRMRFRMSPIQSNNPSGSRRQSSVLKESIHKTANDIDPGTIHLPEISHLVPESKQRCAATFHADKAAISSRLVEQDPSGKLDWYCRSVNPYPLAIPSSHLDRLGQLQKVLHQTIKRVVESYFEDSRLRKLLSLPEHVSNALRPLSRIPFEIGSYRPDFLHDSSGDIRICEINARYSFNAFLMSQYCFDVMPPIQRDSKLYANHFGPAPQAHSNNQPILQAFLSKIGDADKVYIVKSSEPGVDVHFFCEELCRRKVSVELIAPDRLPAVRSGSAHFFLELSQREIAQPDCLTELVRLCAQGRCTNDLRTIFLAHDKRMLALFHSDEIIKDYCNEEEAALLRRYVIPTHVLKENPESLGYFEEHQPDLVLKPNLLGKGEGITFGGSVTKSAWRKMLRAPGNADFVVQKLVRQSVYPIYHQASPAFAEGSPKIVSMNVVGTMLCFDQQFLGPGIYRSSVEPIVNVCRGGTILVPFQSQERGV